MASLALATSNAEAKPPRLTVGGELPARMTAADMMRAFDMGRTSFYAALKAHEFDRFELLPRIGARAWSGALVKSYFDGQAVGVSRRRNFGR